jgi:type I restriction-modification system DNA methylase subunit
MNHNKHNALSKSKSSKAVLNKLRLITATETFRNISNKSAPLAHIQEIAYITELSDRYALRILLNWLATKYGLPAYTKGDSSAYFILESFPCLATEYPFNEDGYPLDEQDPSQSPSLLVKKAQKLLDTGLEAHLQLAGELYEEIYANSLKLNSQGQFYIQKDKQNKSTGMFYTPQSIVNHCLKYGLASTLNQKISQLTETWKEPNNNGLDSEALSEESFCIFDPACGSGNFLHGTINYLQELALPIQGIYGFAKNSLYGTDIDASAISLCRILTVISLSPYFRELSLKKPNSLSQAMEDLIEKLRLHITVGNPLVEALATNVQAKFDLVITNPPYISYGARGQEKLASDWQKLIKQQLPHGSEYKIRLHSLFQELCLKLTKPEGHTLMLVPDAFLTGQHYAKLRTYILKESKIISLNILSQQAFDKVCAGRWCIAVYQRQTLSKQDIVDVNSQNSNKNTDTAYDITLRNIDKQESTKIAWQDLVSKDLQRFQLLFTPYDRQIFRRLRDLPPLKNYLTGHTGIRAKAGRNSIVAASPLDRTWQRGLISGSQVNPFQIETPQHYINIDSTKLYAGGFDPQNIAVPKILVRQTGDRLVAAVDNTGLYHLNNIHSFAPGTKVLPMEHKDFLYFVSALMNSKLWLYLYQMKSQEQGKVMAQIDIEIVESLPLPEIQGSIPVQISQLVQKHCVSDAEFYIESDKESAKAIPASVRKEIDSWIYGLYKLSQEEVNYINNLYPAPGLDEHTKNTLLLAK